MKILADTKTFKVINDTAACMYDAASGFPGGDRYGLSSQIRRTAVSMTTSVAESCAAARREDMLHLLRSACTKLRSLQYQIGLAQRLGYITERKFALCDRKAVEADSTLKEQISQIGSSL